MTITSLLLCAAVTFASTGDDLVPFEPARIPGLAVDAPAAPPVVGGQTTGGYAAVGALVSIDADGYGGDFCSGTLIDDRAVVTAAHCVEAMGDNTRAGYPYHFFVVGTDIYAQNGIGAERSKRE